MFGLFPLATRLIKMAVLAPQHPHAIMMQYPLLASSLQPGLCMAPSGDFAGLRGSDVHIKAYLAAVQEWSGHLSFPGFTCWPSSMQECLWVWVPVVANPFCRRARLSSMSWVDALMERPREPRSPSLWVLVLCSFRA